HCGSAGIRQDPDVLDTWFSSGLWPFSTLGWPHETGDLAYFYPTSVMETGYDILFFWVARMIMLGLEMTGDIPFDTVYLHGLIRDGDGRKMSKSTGNVIDPVEVMDEYGTDALRFTLLTGSSPGNDMKLAYDRIEGNRNFANKIWNAARFVITNLSGDFDRIDGQALEARWDTLTLPDRWILSRLNRLIGDATRLMDAYQFGEAGRQINDFFWSEFADWYIEIAKIRLYGEDEDAAETTRQVLTHVLEQAIRLLHPFMPFITEEVWQRMPRPISDFGFRTSDLGPGIAEHIPQSPIRNPQWEGEALIIARWPEAGQRDADAESEMGLIQELIRGIRNARAEYNVDPGRRIAAIISADGQARLLRQHASIITALARLDEAQLEIVADLAEPPAQAASVVVGDGVQAYLPLAGLVDLDRERDRLASAIEEVKAEIAKAEDLLGNDQFTSKAPAEVVQRERDKLAEARDRLARLQERVTVLDS
ncbi:MAG: class I tRNA ligase family protein, partial [Anaerolineae bacterium]